MAIAIRWAAEKIDAIVDVALATYPPPLPVYRVENGQRRVVDIRSPREPVPYTSKQEFLRLNPNCCFLTDKERKGPGVTFMSRVTGAISTFAVARYQVRYRDDEGNIVSVPYSIDGAVDNCGIVHSGY